MTGVPPVAEPDPSVPQVPHAAPRPVDDQLAHEAAIGRAVMMVQRMEEEARERIRQRTYPVQVRGGIIFAYLGDDAPPAFPDGSAVDEAGYVWNAEFHGARLVRISPSGEIDRVESLPFQLAKPRGDLLVGQLHAVLDQEPQRRVHQRAVQARAAEGRGHGDLAQPLLQ